jgi:hypothetical protein
MRTGGSDGGPRDGQPVRYRTDYVEALGMMVCLLSSTPGCTPGRAGIVWFAEGEDDE